MSQENAQKLARVRRSGGAPAAREEAAALPSNPLGRLAEWSALLHLLQDVLDAVAPFQAGIVAVEQSRIIDAARRRETFVGWRPCQARIYRLVEFSERVRHIGRPYRREPRHLRGVRWAVEIVALQSMIEDTLSDRYPLPSALVELIDELRTVCLRHVALANRELRSLALAQIELLEAPGRAAT